MRSIAGFLAGLAAGAAPACPALFAATLPDRRRDRQMAIRAVERARRRQALAPRREFCYSLPTIGRERSLHATGIAARGSKTGAATTI
jgi:hypothetical protein